MQDTQVGIDEMARQKKPSASPEKNAQFIEGLAAKLNKWGCRKDAANLRAMIAAGLPIAQASENVTAGLVEAAAANVETVIETSSAVQSNSYDATPYVAQDGEIDLALAAIKAGQNPLFVGGAGCGKTHLVHHLAKVLGGRPIYTLQGADGVVPEYVIGYRDVENGNTIYRYGLAVQAAKDPRGAILYWDEPNATPDGIRFWLFSLMDGRREVTLPENNGELVKANPNFIIIGAMNEGRGYSGTSRLNDALRERFTVIDMAYLPAAREKKLLAKRTGCTAEIADKLVSLGKQLRASFDRGELHTPFGTRSLLKAAGLIQQGVKPLDAARVALINMIPSNNAQERKAVQTANAAFFGKSAEEAAKEGVQ